ncbi:MAG: hypothetical protein IJX84_12635 [Clostridia bacterium]|nr:hypothetical protein [Clostridia bacterium]
MFISVPDLMRETRNFFPAAAMDGTWTLLSGALSPADGFRVGDWVAVTGSVCNNGVYQLGEGCVIPGATDESWEGRIWLLTPPADFLALAGEIAAWAKQQGSSAAVKESFGAYSRELATDSDGTPITWQAYFARQLMPYRRMYTEVKL